MKKIDDTIPSMKLIPTTIVVTVIGAVLELSGVWLTMVIAGGLAGLFLRDHRRAFAAGLFGIAIAWSALFAYLVVTADALRVGSLFASLLGLSGLGWLPIMISVMLGALLGGFGALLVRSLVELIDGLSVAYPGHQAQPPSG
ncbi:MAG: hypothetical protein HXY34_10195 [Candidatus Thorarchaeota archaeon]|nr:hypothetical protein [Candidatus Thorarchaeota archaeon]